MKKLTVLLGLTIVSFLSFGQNSNSLGFLGDNIALSSSTTQGDYSWDVLITYNVLHLYQLNDLNCPSASINQIYSDLLPYINSTDATNISGNGQLVRIDVFTSIPYQATNISLTDIAAVSISSYNLQSSNITQYYLRANNGMFSIDQRLTSFVSNWSTQFTNVLHFSSFESDDLPQSSSEFTFKITDATVQTGQYTSNLISNFLSLTCGNNGIKVWDVDNPAIALELLNENNNPDYQVKGAGGNDVPVCNNTVSGCDNQRVAHSNCVLTVPGAFGNCEASHPYGGCPGAAVVVANSQYGITPNNNIPIMPLYRFRDQILFKSAIGKQYINYYYSLSNYIDFSNLSLSTLTDIINYFPSIYNFINRCFSNDPTVVLVDQNFADNTQVIINDLAAISSDPNLQNMLTQVTNDLNSYLNLSQSAAFAKAGMTSSNYFCGTTGNKSSKTLSNTTINYSLQINPNPVHKICNLTIISDAEGSGDIKIVDVSGKVVANKKDIAVFKSKNFYNLDVAGLKNGYYLCVCTINGYKNFIPVEISN